MPARFIPISEREDRSDIPGSAWRALTNNYHLQTWKGIHLDKSPFELALYPMLLHECRIRTIIELGALTGGSAVWLADHLALLGIQGQVLSIDRDLSQLDARARSDARISFLQGDCNDIGKILPGDLLATLPHPWLVIEDAHDGLLAVLDHFHHGGLQAGDYLIVEDTNKDLWEAWSDWEDKEFLSRLGRKMDVLRSWLQGCPGDYMIDAFYQDMFGYNASKNWNSILKRVHARARS